MKKSYFEAAQAGAGVLVGLIAITQSFFPTLLNKFFEQSSLLLFLVGLISVLIGIEKFTHYRDIYKRFESIDTRFESIDARFDNIDRTDEAKHLIYRDKQDVYKLFDGVVRYLIERDQYIQEYSNFSREQIFRYRSKFESLREGELVVSGFESIDIQRRLLDNYKENFFAVSYNDVKFWLGTDNFDSIGKQYFELNKIAATKRGTICSRIFILTRDKIKNKKDDIIKILQNHTRENIGWAIVVYEEMEQKIRETDAALDFALFNHNMALTHFDKVRSAKKFKVIFKMHDNVDVATINTQIQLYCDLIKECWLVDSKFLDIYNDHFGYDDFKREIERQTKLYNASLERKLQPGFTTDHPIFPLVSNNYQQIVNKVEQLLEVLEKTKLLQ